MKNSPEEIRYDTVVPSVLLRAHTKVMEVYLRTSVVSTYVAQ